MQKSKSFKGLILIVLPIIVSILAVGMGRYSISLSELFDIFGSFISETSVGEVNEISRNLVLTHRIPRVITAILVGGGLAVAGVAMQSMFSNPLATPDTIGVSSGAAFGAVLGILMTDNIMITQLMAFGFGIAATYMTVQFSKIAKNQNIVMIVLSGMIVSSFFQALISLVKTLADSDTKLPSIVYWLMGSMTTASYQKLAIGLPFIIIGISIIFIVKWKLNIIALSEDEACSLGINVKKLRLVLLGASTLITSSAVSMCGQIGWIGLIIPHLSRMIVGNNNTKVVPLSISLGIIFMLVVDTFARTMAPIEIPLSIITSLLGTPFFAFLIAKSGGKWT